MKVLKSNWTSIYLVLKSHNLNVLSCQVSYNNSLIKSNNLLGEINLKGVNVKPDKASKLLQGIGLPF